MKGLIIHNRHLGVVYDDAQLRVIAALLELAVPEQTTESMSANPGLWDGVEVLMCGWGTPRFDEVLLDRARNLKAVFYAAGSIKGIVSDAFWERGIVIASAWEANAIPVAQFTVAQIVACLKGVWREARYAREAGAFEFPKEYPVQGCYGAVIGLVSLGAIGRLVCRYLSMFDGLRVIAYDPFVDAATAAELGVTLCPMEEVFRDADVVSLHTPLLPETRGMIRGGHFRLMKPCATFINTARGGLIVEDEMIAVLQERPGITAILDVTAPEPPPPGSPLYSMDNVVLTPHIAGSIGGECLRMGQWMVDELRRYVEGKPLRHAIGRSQAATMA